MTANDTLAADAQARPARRLSPTLGRSAAASAIATLLDSVVAWSLTLLLLVPGAASTLIGAVAGGVTNWLLNRYWAFGTRGVLAHEALRYALVSAGAAVLNTAGVSWLEPQLGFQAAWIVTRGAVFLGFTFVLFRAFVFRNTRSREER